ncbi:MAG: hypothetical protein ACE5KJ_01885 [Candidatus Zixiibacteriota bacterium]
MCKTCAIGMNHVVHIIARRFFCLNKADRVLNKGVLPKYLSHGFGQKGPEVWVLRSGCGYTALVVNSLLFSVLKPKIKPINHEVT